VDLVVLPGFSMNRQRRNSEDDILKEVEEAAKMEALRSAQQPQAQVHTFQREAPLDLSSPQNVSDSNEGGCIAGFVSRATECMNEWVWTSAACQCLRGGGAVLEPARQAGSWKPAASERTKISNTCIKRPYAYYRLNCLLVGESGVGKTSIVSRYKDNRFFTTHCSTVGVEFATQVVRSCNAEDTTTKLHIWDTSGHESFRSLTSSYYTNAAIILIVFDLANRDTYESLRSWISKTKELAPAGALIFLIGNKIDDVLSRQVFSQEAASFAKDNNVPYFETSAKTGEGVEKMFTSSANEIRRLITENIVDVKRARGIKVLA